VIRKSAEKIVNDEQKNSILTESYKAILSKLIKKYRYEEKLNYKPLVNFSTNKNVPIHSWYDYKQGYASELIKGIILSENPSKKHFVLDPFCGVGTTNLVAKELGYDSVGLDINPMAHFAAKVKHYNFTGHDIQLIQKNIQNVNLKKKWYFDEIPKVIESSFRIDQLDILQRIRGYIDLLPEGKSRDFLLLAYLSIIEDASIRVKDGNGLKLKNNKRSIDNLVGYFQNKSMSMLEDLKRTKYDTPTTHHFYNGSLLEDSTYASLNGKKFGISIFSPPYANCFDYCEVYKLEFWLGSFVRTYKDFEKYRSMALRSHVNSKFDHSISNFSNDVDVIADLISTFNIWNKNIPDMIRGYFDDMYELLMRQYSLLVEGGKCFIVVANSGYKGIIVPTDLLIADIAETVGYKVRNIYYARKIRASGQQTIDLHSGYDKLMRESIIEIEKL
jgi:DNA modification methylase